jgi:hypothetical protein
MRSDPVGSARTSKISAVLAPRFSRYQLGAGDHSQIGWCGCLRPSTVGDQGGAQFVRTLAINGYSPEFPSCEALLVLDESKACVGALGELTGRSTANTQSRHRCTAHRRRRPCRHCLDGSGGRSATGHRDPRTIAAKDSDDHKAVAPSEQAPDNAGYATGKVRDTSASALNSLPPKSALPRQNSRSPRGAGARRQRDASRSNLADYRQRRFGRLPWN